MFHLEHSHWNNIINLVCELHNGRGDLRPVRLSLRPHVCLPHHGCGHDVTGLPAKRGDGRDATGFPVRMISVH